MMEEGTFEIKLKIHEESDLYNTLDPDQEMISDDVISYIQRRYKENPDVMDRLVIRIISDVLVREDRVRQNFHTYLEQERTILAKEQRRTAVKQVWLFVIGIIFIAVWLVVAVNTENILVEVLSIIGSFAVWEAANIWIVEAPEMRIRKRRLLRLDETEIAFEVSDKDH